jgi:hypothetical protein
MAKRVFARLGGCGVLLGGTLILCGDALAQSFCSEPIQPVCSVDMAAVTGPPERLRCSADAAQYVEELEAYRGCLRRALEDADDQANAAKQFQTCLEKNGDDCTIDSER